MNKLVNLVELVIFHTLEFWSTWFNNFRPRAWLFIWISVLSLPGLWANGSFWFVFWLIGFAISLGLTDFSNKEMRDKIKHLAFEKNRDKLKIALLHKQIELLRSDLDEQMAAIEMLLEETNDVFKRLGSI